MSCPGSLHMRRRGVALAESSEILCWGLSGKRVVRPMVVESMGEGVDEGLQLIDSMRQIVGCIELISPGRLGAFDAAVEVGALRRQHEEFAQGRFPPNTVLQSSPPGPAIRASFWEWKGQRRQFVSYDREFCIVRIVERDFEHLIDEIAILIQFVEGRLEQFNLHIEVHPNRPVEADETGVNHSLSVFPF
jgi:hypothetical protein